MTFHDPGARNRLTSPLLAEARDILTAAVEAGIRVVILRAEPVAGIWSAGHDIREIPADHSDLSWVNPLEEFCEFLRRVPAATIAEVGGDLWGGACELVLSCDLSVALAGTTMAVTPARLGVAYAPTGVARFLASFPVQVVNRLLLTAEPMTLDEAHRLGAVTEIVQDPADVPVLAMSLAERIAQNAPLTIAAVKAVTGELTGGHLPPEADSRVQQAVVTAWLSDDLSEGLRAFTERRRPDFDGR